MTSTVPHILVVDDLPDWRTTLKGVLNDVGYSVQVAGSRAEALGLLGDQRFDLAVLDVRLDESDEDNTEGIDLAAAIKHQYPEAKVVIITGYGTSETVARSMQPDDQGRRLVEDFVEKTDTDRLVEVVQRVLTR